MYNAFAIYKPPIVIRFKIYIKYVVCFFNYKQGDAIGYIKALRGAKS